MAVITAEFLKSLNVPEAIAAQITAKQAEKDAAAPPPVTPKLVEPGTVAPAVVPIVPPAPSVPAPAQTPAAPKDAPTAAEKPADAPPASSDKSGAAASIPPDVLERLAKLEKEYAAAQEQLKARAYEDAVRAAVEAAKIKFSSAAAERDFYRTAKEKQFKTKADGTLDGLADHIKAMQKAEPDAFASDKPAPRFAAAAPASGQGQPSSSPAKKIVNQFLSEQYGVKADGAAAGAAGAKEG